MFVEDASAFFSTDEFAVIATVNGAKANVIFDQPVEDVLGGSMLSAEYAMTYETADLPTLAPGQTVEIQGASYRVREKPRPSVDGVVSTAPLTKV